MRFILHTSASISAALVVTISLALVGCGGESEGSSSISKTTSVQAGSRSTNETVVPSPQDSARFIAQANAVCRKGNLRLAGSDPKGTAPKEVAAVVVKNEKIERETAGELARLTPPAKLAPAWTKMLGYRRSLANQLGDFAAGVRQGKRQFPALAKSKAQLKTKLAEAGKRAGIKDCAKIG